MFEDEGSDEDDFEGFGGLRHKSVVRELVEMGGRAKLNVTDEEVEEWVNGDKDEAVTFTLSDEDLIDAVLEERYEKKTGANSEKEDDPEPKVTWRDAAKGLAVFVKFAEQCTYMTTRDVMAVHCIQNEFLLQRGKSCKQRDIRVFLKLDIRLRKVYNRPVRPVMTRQFLCC